MPSPSKLPLVVAEPEKLIVKLATPRPSASTVALDSAELALFTSTFSAALAGMTKKIAPQITASTTPTISFKFFHVSILMYIHYVYT